MELAHMNDSSRDKTRIFVSYSHHDKQYLRPKSLLDFLKGLENDGAEFWWDQRITAGDTWDDEIRAQLLRADIALVLVSQWFLDSQYIRNVEVKKLLERVREEALLIFPIILSACDWKRYTWLSRLQHLPDGELNLAQHFNRPGSREAMYSKIRDALLNRFRHQSPAARAIEATSGAVNVINALEPQYRVLLGLETEGAQHSLRYDGLGDQIKITYRGQVRYLTEGDVRHLPVSDLERITTLQRAMRAYHDKWIELYARRTESGATAELQSASRQMAPELLAITESLEQFGLDLEDHYRFFFQLVNHFGQDSP